MLRAFDGLPWHVVLAVGDVDIAALGEVPGNVEVHDRVPQLDVLRHASTFVTHSGMGGTMEALYYQTPMVTLPQTVEQNAVADRVAHLNLGRNLAHERISGQLIKDAVISTATDGDIKKAVAKMSANIHSAGGAPRAVDEIEAYLQRVQRPAEAR